MYAQSPFFRQLVAQESRRIYFSQLKARWAFSLLLAGSLGLAWLLDRPQFHAGQGGKLLAAFVLFNALLQWCGWRGRDGAWTIFVTPLVDHVLISLHLILAAQAPGPDQVAWAPENLIFLFISFYTALRLDYRGLAFSLVCNLAAVSLVFHVSNPGQDPALVARLPELGREGHLIRLILLAAMDGFFFFIPLGLRHLLAKQEAYFHLRRRLREDHGQVLERKVEEKTAELRQTNQELQAALDQVRALEGLLPICSRCKKIRDEQGRWLGLEQYLAQQAGVRVTHGLCQECFSIIYPEIADEVIAQLRDLETEKK